MTEKLSDAEVDEVLERISRGYANRIKSLMTDVLYDRYTSIKQEYDLRIRGYERRIAALDAVLAERRERKNKGENNGT